MRNRRAGAVIPLDPIAENRKKVLQKNLHFLPCPVDRNARRRRLICKVKHNCFKA